MAYFYVCGNARSVTLLWYVCQCQEVYILMDINLMPVCNYHFYNTGLNMLVCVV
jgi:hypothetical protein